MADEIAADGQNRPLVIPIDLTRVDAPVRIGHELGARGLEPEIVVNNAGYGLVGRAAELDRAEQLAMIDLNVRALTDLSLRFIDSLARHRGGILNVASISGVHARSRDGGLPCHQGLRALVQRGAAHRAGAAWESASPPLCPGPVPTEFQARAGMDETQLPRLLICSAEAVAQQAYDGLMRGKRIVVPGWGNQLVRLMRAACTPSGSCSRSPMPPMKDAASRKPLAETRWPTPDRSPHNAARSPRSCNRP